MRILKILTANFEKEGPGINKNDPQKEGFSLFLEILILRFWDIIKLNLIFILYCIPIVTIGPALAAMTSITISMIQRKHIYIFSDFHKAFKSNFKQSFIAGIIYIITIVILSYSLAYYYKLAQNNYFFYSIFFFVFSFSFRRTCLVICLSTYNNCTSFIKRYFQKLHSPINSMF